MPKIAIRLCACALSVLPVLAQQAPPDPAILMPGLERKVVPLANAWLRSSDPRLEAWGAYLALRDRRAEAVPDLLAIVAAFPVVEHLATQLDMDRHDALLEVLDALIEFAAPVPAGDAERIYPEFPVQALILLSRSREDTSPALLTIFRNEPRWPAAWLAAGALLLERRADGFAAAVVESMTVHAQVMVTEPGSGGGMGGGAYCCGGASAPSPKQGWPQVGVYTFAGCGDRLESGAVILAGGTDPSYYRRQVNATYRSESSACGCNPDQDLVRQHYLTTLLGAAAEEPPVRAHVSHAIVWQGPEAYREELAAFIAGQQKIFEELTRRLSGQNLLTAGEADGLPPKLEIRIWDQRASQQPVLPAIASLPENITVEPL